MKLSEFDYELPEELIAQEPLSRRDACRLMTVRRKTGTITHGVFSDITDLVKEGDCLVLNNTKVLPVRLFGRRDTGGKVEIFILNPKEEKLYALINPSRRIKAGEKITLDDGSYAVIGKRTDLGRSVVFEKPLDEVLKKGHMPLPPYVRREDTPVDKDDYQTVYASCSGATASPTAGLHLTHDLMQTLQNKGVNIVYVTLHTSYGTFAPVKTDRVEDHVMHSEWFELTQRSADIINRARETGGKIVAVGTTSTRVLETVADESGKLRPAAGDTKIFIYPGYRFKIVDKIVTNFHLPGSTLIMLVSAFAGKDLIFKAYTEAIRERYRFFSYGDAMMIV